MRTALVFVGGPHRRGHDGRVPLSGSPPLAHPGLVELEQSGSEVVLGVAVDSGLHLATALGRQVDVVVGDMDSVDPALLASLVGVELVRHPSDKDATDLELALDLVLEHGVSHVVVVAADGGRLDHLFGGVLTLCAAKYASLGVVAWLGGTRLVPVHPGEPARIRGRRGDLVSILAVHGPAVGVRTRGLRWPLEGERLDPGGSRGISNELLDDVADVSIDEGCVAVVQPDEEHP
jgi:thiamine pyrophosphokinase